MVTKAKTASAELRLSAVIVGREDRGYLSLGFRQIGSQAMLTVTVTGRVTAVATMVEFGLAEGGSLQFQLTGQENNGGTHPSRTYLFALKPEQAAMLRQSSPMIDSLRVVLSSGDHVQKMKREDVAKSLACAFPDTLVAR
jgi:hypothetical protein